MRRIFLVFFPLIVIFSNGIVSASPDEPVFINEFTGQMDFVKGRLIALAEAVPEDKFNWSPAEGVRDFAEVIIHTAEANHYLVSVMKGTKPEGGKEKSATDQKKVLSMLSASFDAVKDAAGKLTEDDLEREVEAFGMKFSLRNFMITILNHCHEHLGQGIAYARINGITPPWSMKGE